MNVHHSRTRDGGGVSLIADVWITTSSSVRVRERDRDRDRERDRERERETHTHTHACTAHIQRERMIEYVHEIVVGILIAICGVVFIFMSIQRKRKSSGPRVSKDILAELDKEHPKVTLTLNDLRSFNGVNHQKILISLSGAVFDVTSAPEFYGTQGGYHVYAGREAGRALGKMTLGKPQHDIDLESPWEDDLDDAQKKVLDDWVKLFRRKYPVVGTIKGKPSVMIRQGQESMDKSEATAKRDH